MGTLDGKVALISGSGRGIGRAIALKLAQEGARVVVNDVDSAPAEETVHAIVALGGQAVAMLGSVTDTHFAERFVQKALDDFGGLDIIVNNAGYTWDGVIQKMSDEQWDEILNVHLTAPFRILRAAQPVISRLAKKEATNDGPSCRKVINISSLAGLSGNAGQVNYAAAKAGVTGITSTLAKEWGRYNVTVNTVAFGYIQTRLTAAAEDGSSIEVDGKSIRVGMGKDLLAMTERLIPLGRAGTPRDAAGAVYLMCLPESDYISGQTIVCGGGLLI